jgi:hypothetical protein
MIAYKFLREGSRGPFSQAPWPAPGEWLAADAPLEACVNGIHACKIEALAYWFDDELWQVELDGDTLDEGSVLVAPRGRLLHRIDAWPTVSRSFAEQCAQRTRERAAAVPTNPRLDELVGDTEYHAARSDAPRHAVVAAYCAAVAANTFQPDSFDDERALQSRQLAQLLGL